MTNKKRLELIAIISANVYKNAHPLILAKIGTELEAIALLATEPDEFLEMNKKTIDGIVQKHNR